MPDEVTPEASASISQQLNSRIDTGEESFSVDAPIPVAADAEPGTGEPAKEAEVTPEGGEEEEPAKKEEAEAEPAKEEPAKEKEPEKEPDPVEDTTPTGVKRRLAKMRRKQGDAERRADVAERKLSVIEAKDKPKIDVGDEPTEPELSDFEEESEYETARKKWTRDLSLFHTRKVLAEQEETQRQGEEEAADQDLQDVHNERAERFSKALKAGKAKYKDYEDVAGDVKIPNPMIDILEKLDNFGDVVYKIGKEDLMPELAKMSLVDQTIELVRMSKELNSKKKTTTPKPVVPVKGPSSDVKTLETMSMPEYVKEMERREKERP